MKHKIAQPYVSILNFQAVLGITLPRKEEWRLTKEAYLGQINALPTTRGILVATNGMLCYIQQQNELGEAIAFLGHVDFFIPDDVDVSLDAILSPRSASKSKGTRPTKAKVEALLEMYD